MSGFQEFNLAYFIANGDWVWLYPIFEMIDLNIFFKIMEWPTGRLKGNSYDVRINGGCQYRVIAGMRANIIEANTTFDQIFKYYCVFN